MPSFLRMVATAAAKKRRQRERERAERRERAAQQAARCEGKHPFTTFTAAKRAAKMMRRHKGTSMGVYPCRSCHKFHVGNEL